MGEPPDSWRIQVIVMIVGNDDGIKWRKVFQGQGWRKKRLGPIKAEKEARLLQTGSVRMRFPLSQ